MKTDNPNDLYIVAFISIAIVFVVMFISKLIKKHYE
jgi:hypothetical protein